LFRNCAVRRKPCRYHIAQVTGSVEPGCTSFAEDLIQQMRHNATNPDRELVGVAFENGGCTKCAALASANVRSKPKAATQ
jgi:hypothetical protein